MTDDPENLEDRRRKIEAQSDPRRAQDRAEVRRRQIESFVELKKDHLAQEAFADAFVNILRDVNRAQPGPSGAQDLVRLFEMLDRGAEVTFEDLTRSALDRIKPETMASRGHARQDKEEALLRVATAGLAFLIENGAADAAAASRKMKREHDLLRAMEMYHDAEEAWHRHIQGDRPHPSRRP